MDNINESPWNGEIPYRYEPSEHLKKFSEQMAGHLRRELAYRNFAAELLANVRSLENFVGPVTRPLLHDAIGVWEARLKRIETL